MLTKSQINKLNKAAKAKSVGSDIKISKTQIRKSVQHGGNLWSSILSLGSKIEPRALPCASKALSGLATGALSSIGNFWDG